MRKFICYYEFTGVSYQIRVDELVMVESGFWVDSDMEWTNNPKALRFWIPPSRVVYVKLETQEETDEAEKS